MTLARYVDSALFPEEAQRVEEHLARCSSCARQLADTLAILEAGAPSSQSSGQRRGVAVAAGAILVGAMAVAGTWWGLHQRDERRAQSVRAELFRALGGQRPVLGRVSGGMPWAPPGDVVRGARLPEDQSTWRLAAAAESARVLADREPQGPELGALASAHLLLGDADAALATLERAVAASPDDAGLRSDLAAAYIAHSRDGGPADLAQALEHASAALEKEPELAEARFNRALALEGLHLDATAGAAWEEIARTESDSGWAAEARRHLEDVRVTLAAKKPSGPPPDPMLESELAEIAREKGAAVADGARKALAAAVAAREGDDLEQARRQVATAERIFPPLSAGSRRIELERIACEYYTNGSTPELRNRASAVESAASDSGDLVARGRARWMVGLIDVNHGDLTSALRNYLGAIDDETAARNPDAISWLQLLASEVYGLIGDDRNGWAQRTHALQAIRAARDPIRARDTLVTVGMASVMGSLPRVAVATFEELDALQREQGGRPTASELVEASVWKARAALALNRGATATREMGAAMAYLPRIELPFARRWYAADLNLTRSQETSAPEIAAAASTRAIAGFSAIGREGQIPAAMLFRARAYRRMGRLDLAESDLRRGVSLVEDRQKSGAPGALWISPARIADGLYGELASLELQRQRPDAAFALLERGRSRALSAASGEIAPGKGLTPTSLQARIDPGTALLVFGTIDGREVVWRVDSDGSRHAQVSVPIDDLAAMVTRWKADLAAGAWTSDSQELASNLFAALLGPLELGPEVDRLVIVPGEALDGLPFAALVDPDSGHYLVQQWTVEIAPSVGVYLAAAGRRRAMRDETPAAMVLGDPRADARLFPSLPSLPGGAEEARRVAAIYKDHSLAVGSAATRDALLAGLRGRTVLHVAAHSLVNTNDPARSALVLAPGAGSPSGALYASEIAALPLDGVRTVVLAACESATGPQAGREGSLSLARAFLAARVPTVVASLWPITDRRSVELVTALHAHLSYGSDAAASLRAAQLRMLASSDAYLSSPATWAAFEALGG